MGRVLRDLLGEWCLGRLGPRRFALLYATIIGSLAGLIVFTIAWATTIMTMVDSPSSSPAATWPAGLIFFTFLALLAALFNITVKRGRDIGIPGFIMGIGFVILFCMGGVTIFLSILLALVPSGTFARSNPTVEA
ncbi:MAG: hypothetical protein ACJ8E3_03945 [Sphingomicrobium sp.]